MYIINSVSQRVVRKLSFARNGKPVSSILALNSRMLIAGALEELIVYDWARAEIVSSRKIGFETFYKLSWLDRSRQLLLAYCQDLMYYVVKIDSKFKIIQTDVLSIDQSLHDSLHWKVESSTYLRPDRNPQSEDFNLITTDSFGILTYWRINTE